MSEEIEVTENELNYSNSSENEDIIIYQKGNKRKKISKAKKSKKTPKNVNRDKVVKYPKDKEEFIYNDENDIITNSKKKII